MKTMILAAFAALTLTAAVAPVASAASFNNSTVAGDTAATQMQQQGSLR